MFRPAFLALLLAADPVPPPAPVAAPVPEAPPAAPAPAALPALPAPPGRAPRPPRPPRPPSATENRLQGEWPARPSGKKVTLSDRVSLDDALAKIAEAAGWNLAAHTGREGDRVLVLTMKDAGVEEALQAVLSGTGMVATRRGNGVTVAPGTGAAAEVPVLSGFDRPTGKRFTGDFSDDGVDEALTKVADAAGLSLVLPPGMRGTVTGHFKEAPVEEVLRVILGQAGLTGAREGSILTVSRREGSGRLVIKGGKRQIFVDGDLDLPDVNIDIGATVKEATDEARRAAKEAQREAKRALRKKSKPDAVRTGDYTLRAGERAQEVVVLRGSATLEPGSTAQQVVAVLGGVNLGEGVSVDGDVVAVLGDIHVHPGARVGGDAVSVGGKLIIDEGAVVEGQQVSVDVPGIASILGSESLVSKAKERSLSFRIGGVIAQFAAFFALGLLFLLLAPRRLDSVAASLSHRPLKTVLTGLLGTIALPVLTLLLVVTVIGIPLVAVQVIGILVAAILGYTALALFLGRALPIHTDRGGQVLRLALGTALMVVIFRIPVIGVLAGLTAWLVVFGAVILTRFGQPQPVIDTTMAPPAPPPPPPPPAPVA
ncbi:MAG: hypothetical protein HZB56_00230 [Deltaproteobacteria bacterium]|nr:hypothetical protein [Deltaproteobacteria bacterium]